MSNYIDIKYLNLLSSQLEQFKRKNDQLWNFRCPFCGDSQKDKTKARGYVFLNKGNHVYKCHNCGQSCSVAHLIKHVNQTLYREYVTESFVDKGRKAPEFKTKTDIRRLRKPQYVKDTALRTIKKISQLKADHPAKKYCVRRNIPTSMHFKLFYAPKFYKWCNESIPDKFDLTKVQDEPRLVIPFIDQNNKLIGFQGRAFGNSQPKYITIMLDEDAPKIFGLDTVDWNKTVVVVEGPIDSLFIANSIAMAGADASRLNTECDLVYCYDNEPRSKEIVSRIEKTIRNNDSVVIWPSYVKEKDINDMVLAGIDVSEINSVISNNTFKGLAAMAKLSEWRKV